MINEICSADFCTNDCQLSEKIGKMNGRDIAHLEMREPDLKSLFQKALYNDAYPAQIHPVMACSRDFHVEFCYEDKHGNKYGINVDIKGNKESEENNEITRDGDDRTDSTDRDYD